MVSLVRRLWQEEDGQAMTEYGLILGILAVAVIGILIAMRGSLVNIFQAISGGLSDGAAGGSGT